MGRQTLFIGFSTLMNCNGVIGSEWVLNFLNYFKSAFRLTFALSIVAAVMQQNIQRADFGN